jgi:hypothetical protein
MALPRPDPRSTWPQRLPSFFTQYHPIIWSFIPLKSPHYSPKLHTISKVMNLRLAVWVGTFRSRKWELVNWALSFTGARLYVHTKWKFCLFACEPYLPGILISLEVERSLLPLNYQESVGNPPLNLEPKSEISPNTRIYKYCSWAKCSLQPAFIQLTG